MSNQKKSKKEKKDKKKEYGKKDERGVYIPTEDEVISKREWSQINKL